jgi:hypothetical protein
MLRRFVFDEGAKCIASHSQARVFSSCNELHVHSAIDGPLRLPDCGGDTSGCHLNFLNIFAQTIQTNDDGTLRIPWQSDSEHGRSSDSKLRRVLGQGLKPGQCILRADMTNYIKATNLSFLNICAPKR